MPNEDAKHILLVEDDVSLAQWFCDYLSEQGYLVTLANRGDVAVLLIKEDNPDLVVLDIMLPVKDGFAVCEEVREFYQGPILMMTARDQETDEIHGLELGADDYLTKPVKPKVLLARIKALLRRQTSTEKPVSNIMTFGTLVLDKQSRTTHLQDEMVVLSSNEFDALMVLANNAGSIVSRAQLVTELRGIEYDGFDRSADMLISRLRKKLGDDPSNPVRIKTVWGKGYLFAKDAWT
ncbi:MAG: response regulator transcription factor [Psychrobium sp.]|nr:response regulator transcription factor [Psychrobium sp.]